MSLFKFSKSPRILVSVFAKTDVGKTRDHNEDTFLVADLTNQRVSLQPDVREHEVGNKGSLFMVADGMGGAAAGEVASEIATSAIYEHLVNTWIVESETTPRQFAYRLREAVERANAKIHTYAREHPDLKGMGTTTTAAGLLGDTIYLTQVGDSRAYLVRDGEAIQLTKDQSLMQRLVDAGELTEEEAERSERRNIILQALGPDAKVRVDLTHQPVRRGDALVICSDGLSGQVRKEEIAQAVARNDRDLVDICGELIDLANERGGPDNITVLIARFSGDGLRDSTTADRVGHKVFPMLDADSITEPVPAYPESTEPTPADRPRMIAAGVTSALLMAAAIALATLGW